MEYLSTCLCQSFFSFLGVLEFSIYRSFVSLGRFIARYFILFVAVLNGIGSLISPSDFSWLVYRNSSEFCVLTLYHTTLLNSLFSSSNFFFYQKIVSFGFSMCSIMSFAKVRVLLLFRSGFLFFLSLLIAIARTFKAMLNNRSENGHCCLFPDLRGNAFHFSSLRIMFAVGLSYMAFTMLT